MANSYFNWPASLNRFVPLDTARADDVNDAFDALSAGLDEVSADIASAIKISSTSVSQEIPDGAGARAGKVITFDEDGNVMLSENTYDSTLADAAAAQASAEAAAASAATAQIAADGLVQTADGVKDLFIAGTHYTSGVTTQLTLSQVPVKANAVKVFFDGVYQNKDTWSRVGNVITFNTALVVDDVEVQYEIPSLFIQPETLYLGAQASGPALDGEGNPLIAGVKYFNTTDNKMYVRNTSGTWQLDTADSGYVNFVPAGTGAVASTVQSKLREFVSADDFEAVGNDIVDDTSKLQALFDAGAGKLVKLRPGAVYRCSSGLTVKGDVNGQGATLKFYGATAGGTFNSCMYQTVEGSLRNFTIDATNVMSCQNGLFVDTDFAQKSTCYYDITIKNVSNSNNTQGCNGALFYKSSSASVNLNSKLDIKIDVENVTGTANGVIGDEGGAATGIFISFNGVGTDSHVIIRDSIIKNILPVEDSGGIQLFVGNHTVATAKGFYLVENCKVYNAKKRGFKIQAQNTTVQNCFVDGAATEIGYDTYAVNTAFVQCKEINAFSTAFRSSCADTTIESCSAKGSTQQPLLLLTSGSSGATILNSIFANSATLATLGNRVATIEDSTYAKFVGTAFSTSGTVGSIAIMSGTNNLTFTDCVFSGGECAIQLAYSTGSLNLSGCTLNAATWGIYRLGNSANPIKIRNSVVSAGVIGLYLSSSGASNAATVDCDGSTIFAGTHGVLGPAGCRITNNQIISANTSGQGIGCGNSVARNNQITKFATGIAYDYTTTAEVANNVTIGSTAPYTKVGYTIFVDHNNNSR